MNILVLGQGGREHALIQAFLISPSVSKIYCAPGNAGIARDVPCLRFSLCREAVLFCLENFITFVFVGPEQPLVEGWADEFRRNGIPTVGPGAHGAKLEGSKSFSKEFLHEAGVPTANYEKVASVSQAIAAASRLGIPCVLKADGLAAGKGVLICQTARDVEEAARIIFEERRFGAAGLTAIVEEFSVGSELSYLILTNGKEYQSLPLVQDHKRLSDGDVGPNTGGMGTVAPLALSKDLNASIRRLVIEPTLLHMTKTGMEFRGILFVGIMMTEEGPSVLEFNVRFGDPEAQVILPLLDGDWAEVFHELALGRLVKMNWLQKFSACVVIAAEGYPDYVKQGAEISALTAAESGDFGLVKILHAGTSEENGTFKVSGGRVLNVVSTDVTLSAALKNIYGCTEKLKWKGCQYRTDIGHKVVTNSNLFGQN